MAVSTSSDAAPDHGRVSGLLFGIGPLLAGLLLAAVILGVGLSGEKSQFEEFALGEGTTAIFARVDDRPVHCKGVEDADDCLAAAMERDLPAAALWFGNSQLHAINQLKPGEQPAPAHLHRRLEKQGLDLLTFSQPNANLQEHYVLFEYLRSRLPLKLFVLAVTFDDLRETGLRPDLTLALRDPATVSALKQTEIGRTILGTHDDQQAIDPDLAGVQATVQEHSERALNGWLDHHFPLWAARREARGKLFTGLFNLRNTVFGITPQSKRRKIPGRYRMNMAALEATLDSAVGDGIRTLVYVIPLRDDVDIPYVVEDYEAFKSELRQVVVEHGAEFADLEDTVPAEYWGRKDSTTIAGDLELDFMHFQAFGHKLLADAVGELVERPIPDDPS